jgi:aminoglycoside phosphotransferase (APT) family kinase protein
VTDPPTTPGHRMPPAEQEVDESRARALLAQVGLGREPLRLLGVGWDNTVWQVGAQRVARFPRRAGALPLLELELAVLPTLAQRLPLPVPVPERRARTMETRAVGYPWPFWVGRLVPGRELGHAGLADDQRGPLAAEVGALLAELHRPALADEVAALVPGLPHDPTGRGDLSRRVPWARETVARVVDLGLGLVSHRTVIDLLGRATGLRLPPREPVLCHGDLHLRHVLARDDGHAGGVIDWGDVCLADPAIDLAFGYAALTGSARDRLLSAYRRAGGTPLTADQETLARLLALGLCAMLALTAHETGDTGLREEALAGMTRAVS